MPGWRPLPRIAFAVCTYPFHPSSPADLPLEIGDELYIIEQGGKDGSWFRGYLVAPPSLLAGLTCVQGQTLEARVFSGIFPRCCVEVREVLGEGKASLEDQGKSPDARAGAGDYATHGLITPTESTRATSSPANPSLHLRRSSRSDQVSVLPSSASRPLSRSQPSASHNSQWTSRSEHLQQLALPLSPISPTSQDPTAPRPPAPVPMLKIGDETPTSAQEPLVDEIASCLREWHSTKLHELLLAGKYKELDKLSAVVQRLDTARRQLLHKVLTAKELQKLREATVWNLVAGNKMLCGHVIVRSPSERGRVLTGDDSAIEVTRLQSAMSLLEEQPTPPVDEHNLHHLFVTVKQVLGDITSGTPQLCMYLCSKSVAGNIVPLSEAYAFDLANKDGTVVSLAGGKLKSLFVDLSSNDVGEGTGAGTQLYLVFRLVSYEPVRTIVSSPGPSQSPQPGGATSPPVQQSQFGSLKGRRSVMFGSKRKDTAASTTSPTGTRPSIERSPVISRDGRPESSSAKGRTSPHGQKLVKRTVAVGVLRVDALMRSQSELDQSVTLWTPAIALDEVPEDGTSWDEVLKDLFPSPNATYKKHSPISGLTLHLKAFAHPDAAGLIKKTPTLLHNIKQTRKIGFSGAPTKARDDIYVTLTEACLPKNASLSHPKTGSVPIGSNTPMCNLQLTLEVRKSSGARIENCIFPSSNSAGHTAWRTPAAERGEKWNVTVRLALRPEDVVGSHIIMSIAEAPGFPFALCWIPLWNQDAFIRDGEHTLALYRYDEYTSSIIGGKGAYLGLPWNARKKDEQIMGTMASVRLSTYLCSTAYSQDPNLLGLLKWREQAAGQLIPLLKRVPFIPEIEVVKLLNEVFDALFEILVEYAGSDEYEDLVFNALVVVLGIVHDRRFNLTPLVDQYAETRFKYPFATSCLVRSYTRLLANPTDPECSRRLREAFKVGRQILKFILNARQQQKEKEKDIGITSRQPTFSRDLRSIFSALDSLMRNPSPLLVGTKTILVQHFHAWLPELSSSVPAADILRLASSFVDSCSAVTGRLVLYKLLLIYHLSVLPVFKSPEVRKTVLSSTVKWLDPHWGTVEAVTDQWRDQVRLCCSVVASQAEELGHEACDYVPKLIESYRAIQATPRHAKKTLSLLFPTALPFPSRTTTMEASFDEAMTEIAGVLAAISCLPTFINLDRPNEDIADFLLSALQVYSSILACEAFPPSWFSVHIYQHKATLRTLEKVAGVLIDKFLPDPDDADSFNTELWRTFFDTLLQLVGSDALALETFPEQKRRAVWKIAGDVRESGAELLQRCWDAIGWEATHEEKKQYGLERMGGYQVQYVPGLVPPIVSLCLSVHEGLRSVAIRTLQTMIVSEWTLSNDLSLIQAEMVDTLDQLFRTKHLTEVVLQKHFIRELVDLFEPLADDSDDGLFDAVKDLIATLDELLDLLVAVHSTEAVGEVFHIMDTLHLMEFLKDMQREDIYINYVHRLVGLQAEARNFTEAGLALRLHAELYDWDTATILEPLVDPEFPAQSSFERKEQLYFKMIEYSELGSSWDNALSTYMELVPQYEHNVFDFAKLARAQHAMATIHETIAKGGRSNPRYFRVVYKGLGFPVGLRDKQFIFEGSPQDRLATFADKLQQQHPTAQILNAGAEEDVEGQFLQIFPVSPQKDMTHPIYQRPKVAQAVRDYCLLSRPTQFTSTSRRVPSDGPQYETTVEKTVYTTAEPFPTILRRSEIVTVGTVTLTPLQTAIDRTTRKTAELASLEKRIQKGDESAMATLASDLTLAVDTEQELCVAHYHNLLPLLLRDPDAMDSDDGEEPLEPSMLENALSVALIDHALTIRRCLGLYTRPAQQATKADLNQRFEHAYGRELAVLAQPQGAPNQPSGAESSAVGVASPPQIPSPLGRSGSQLSGSRLRSPTLDSRAARENKKRLSLAFFKGTGTTETSAETKPRKSTSEPRPSDAVSSHSQPVEHPKASRLSLSFLATSGSLGDSLQQFTNPDKSEEKKPRRSQSTERRPPTSKSGKSEETKGDNIRKGSVRKRLSMLTLGKKTSKNSVKIGERVAEE
ncbi:hypothetical protein M011DRAFT_466356 [Sporormia fimetaria CBS 119925]|uniref:Uncharacterized protein n=1 Tax=Sporormia fimetaria CBS 119925 TaxID=1340428 RepID=A0A6A6VF93_9PLEO|nr:hypothetical protein M011DRAFT_466356 [Sporormia fimetaria CBS 119925]